MGDAPTLECPWCEAPLHPAEPCECRGGRQSDGPDDWCPCEGSGWVWWETGPDPPVRCPVCEALSVVRVDSSGDGHAYSSLVAEGVGVPNPREQLASLFAEFFASGTPRQSYDYADRAQAIAHREIVEECVAGAVVETLPYGNLPGTHCPECDLLVPEEHRETRCCPVCDWQYEYLRPWRSPPIPIAHAPKMVAAEVAGELQARYSAPDRLRGCKLIGVPAVDPPFAAAVTVAGGTRTYTLASTCSICDGTKIDLSPGAPPESKTRHVCCGCDGVGARVDCKAIAGKYQPDRPWRDEDTARLARFEVVT